MIAPRVVGLVAAYNEEARIGPTVRSMLRIEGLSEVVVVADGSADRTAQEANEAGARVLMSPGRLGKGTALEAALSHVPPADVYLLVDGDVAQSAAESAELLAPVMVGKLDLAIGRLPPQAGGGFGLVKRPAAWLIRIAAGFVAAEPLSGQRAITRQALEGCRPLARGFGLEVGMTIDAARLGFRVAELPVAMSHRPTGRRVAGFAHRARQGVDILRAALPRLVKVR